MGSLEILANTFTNKIESLLLLSQYRGAPGTIPLTDFNNFLKHLDEKILFNQLDESMSYNTEAAKLEESQIRASLIEQPTEGEFLDTKLKKLVYFIKKLEVEENVRMRVLAFVEDVFQGVRTEIKSYETKIESLEGQLAADTRRFESEKKKLSDALANITEREIKIVEAESELQSLRQKFLKAESDRNHLKLEYDQRLGETLAQLSRYEGQLENRTLEVAELQRRVNELVTENTDLNQLNEHRRKTLDQMKLAKDTQLSVEMVRLQVENEGMAKRMADLNAWLAEKEKELDTIKSTSQREVDEFRALANKYADRVAELEAEAMRVQDPNQSLDIRSSMQLTRRPDGDLSTIEHKPKNDSFEMRPLQIDEEISILNAMDQPLARKNSISNDAELKKALQTIDGMKTEHLEALAQAERHHQMEIRQLLAEKQAIMAKLNEAVTRNIEDTQRIKDLELQLEKVNERVDRLAEKLMNEENTVKYLKGENQKLHDELKRSIVATPSKSEIRNSVKRILVLVGPRNFYRLNKKFDLNSNFNMTLNAPGKKSVPEISAEQQAAVTVHNPYTGLGMQTNPELGVGSPQQLYAQGRTSQVSQQAAPLTQSSVLTSAHFAPKIDDGSALGFNVANSQSLLHQSRPLVETLYQDPSTVKDPAKGLEMSQTARDMMEFLDATSSPAQQQPPVYHSIGNNTPFDQYAMVAQGANLLRPGHVDTPQTSQVASKDTGTHQTSTKFEENKAAQAKIDAIFKKSLEMQQQGSRGFGKQDSPQTGQVNQGVGVLPSPAKQAPANFGGQASVPGLSESVLIDRPNQTVNVSIPQISEQDFAIFDGPKAPSIAKDSQFSNSASVPADAMKKKPSLIQQDSFMSNLTEKQRQMLGASGAQSARNVPNQIHSLQNLVVPRTPEPTSKLQTENVLAQKFASASQRNTGRIFDDPKTDKGMTLGSQKLITQGHVGTTESGGVRQKSSSNFQAGQGLYPSVTGTPQGVDAFQSQTKRNSFSVNTPTQQAGQVSQPDIPLADPQRRSTQSKSQRDVALQPDLPLPQSASKRKTNFSDQLVSRIKMLKSKIPDKPLPATGSRYSYNHLNMEIFIENGKYVLRESVRRQNTACFSDIVNRMNKWGQKTEKYIIVVNDNVFLFNHDRTIKKRYPIRLKSIRKIEVNADTNFFCIIDVHNQFEVIESIRKEELINFIIKLATMIGHSIAVEKVRRMFFENTEKEQVVFNPAEVKKYKPYWTPAFNYAQKHTCMSYAKRDPESLNIFESIFDNKDKCLLVLTNLAVLVLSTIEFNIKDVVPLCRVKVLERDRDIVLTMNDGTRKVLSFFSELDKNIWANAIRETIKVLDK